MPRGPAFWTFLKDFGESKTHHILDVTDVTYIFVSNYSDVRNIIGQEGMNSRGE